MNLALLGYGRLGHEIERLARARGHRIVAAFHPSAKEAAAREVTAERLANAQADVCVECSLPKAVLANVMAACEARKPLVVATTGWDADLPKARELVAAAGIGMIHAPNFAIGVQTMFRLIADAATTLDRLAPGGDAAIFESHHRGKADSPSGTAKRLGRLLLEAMSNKSKLVTGPLQRPIAADEIHVVSQRVGADPGTHVVLFDLGEETLEIRHHARSRAVFAAGVLKAAEWIRGRTGVFEFRDMME